MLLFRAVVPVLTGFVGFGGKSVAQGSHVGPPLYRLGSHGVLPPFSPPPLFSFLLVPL